MCQTCDQNQKVNVLSMKCNSKMFLHFTWIQVHENILYILNLRPNQENSTICPLPELTRENVMAWLWSLLLCHARFVRNVLKDS
jgi:hypothetical protein